MSPQGSSQDMSPPPPVPTVSLQSWPKPQGPGHTAVVEGEGAAWGLPEAGTHHWSPKSAGRCLRTWERRGAGPGVALLRCASL